MLDPPRLVVTRCKKRALCVDVLPPVEDLRSVYQELHLQLVVRTSDTLEKMVGLQNSHSFLPYPSPISICDL